MSCWIPGCIDGSTLEYGGQFLRHGVANDEAADAPEHSSELDAGEGTMVKQKDRKLDCGNRWGIEHLGG